MKKIIIALLLIVLTGTALYVFKHKKKNPNELTLFGNIEIRQVDLSFQVGGKILKMLKEEGDSVKTGEVVAIMDDRDYKANYEKSNAEADMTKAMSENALSQYERNAPLCPENTISKEECDNLLHTKDETTASYKAALAAKQAAKNNLDYTKVYAPEEGIVTVRIQEPGAVVNEGQPIYTVAKDKPIWIRTYVSETDLGNIKYGMKAKVLTDCVGPSTGKKREYDGWIGYISPVAEFTPKTVQTEDLRTDLVYRVRVYVYDVDKYLRQGMPTTVKVDLTQNQND